MAETSREGKTVLASGVSSGLAKCQRRSKTLQVRAFYGMKKGLSTPGDYRGAIDAT